MLVCYTANPVSPATALYRNGEQGCLGTLRPLWTKERAADWDEIIWMATCKLYIRSSNTLSRVFAGICS